MSEFENEIENEVEVAEEAVEAEVEAAAEEPEAEAAEPEAAEEEPADEAEEPVVEKPAKPVKEQNEELINKVKRAENLLFRRRVALERAAEEKASQVNELARAIKLLDLKPKMEQKEMADLLGMRLRELDTLLAEAEKVDLVGRIEPEEPDMRKVVVFASEDAIEHVGDIVKKDEPLVPGLSQEEIDELFAQLDKVINPLVAMGLDEDRGPRGGRDDRGPRGPRGGRDDRGGDRGGRGGFGGHRESGDRSHGKFGAPRMGFGGSRGGHSDRNDRGGYGDRKRGGRDDRGGRGGYGDRNDRNNRGGRGNYGGRDRY